MGRWHVEESLAGALYPEDPLINNNWPLAEGKQP